MLSGVHTKYIRIARSNGGGPSSQSLNRAEQSPQPLTEAQLRIASQLIECCSASQLSNSYPPTPKLSDQIDKPYTDDYRGDWEEAPEGSVFAMIRARIDAKIQEAIPSPEPHIQFAVSTLRYLDGESTSEDVIRIMGVRALEGLALAINLFSPVDAGKIHDKDQTICKLRGLAELLQCPDRPLEGEGVPKRETILQQLKDNLWSGLAFLTEQKNSNEFVFDGGTLLRRHLEEREAKAQSMHAVERALEENLPTIDPIVLGQELIAQLDADQPIRPVPASLVVQELYEIVNAMPSEPGTLILAGHIPTDLMGILEILADPCKKIEEFRLEFRRALVTAINFITDRQKDTAAQLVA